MQETDLEQALRAVLREGTLYCEDAHRLAEEQNVTLAEIGRMANKLGIKIKACQLGCF